MSKPGTKWRTINTLGRRAVFLCRRRYQHHRALFRDWLSLQDALAEEQMIWDSCEKKIASAGLVSTEAKWNVQGAAHMEAVVFYDLAQDIRSKMLIRRARAAGLPTPMHTSDDYETIPTTGAKALTLEGQWKLIDALRSDRERRQRMILPWISVAISVAALLVSLLKP